MDKMNGELVKQHLLSKSEVPKLYKNHFWAWVTHIGVYSFLWQVFKPVMGSDLPNQKETTI